MDDDAGFDQCVDELGRGQEVGLVRGPDEAALKSELQQKIDKSFKPGLLEFAGLKRQGSSPLPAAASGAPRVVVYYNATLRLKEGYDFKDWEGLSPATLAQVLGGKERGVFGVKAKENQPGVLVSSATNYLPTPRDPIVPRDLITREGLEAGALIGGFAVDGGRPVVKRVDTVE